MRQDIGCRNLDPIYTRKNLTTCQQDVSATDLLQACQQVVTTLLFYHALYHQFEFITCC
jgi:hypothetical protein